MIRKKKLQPCASLAGSYNRKDRMSALCAPKWGTPVVQVQKARNVKTNADRSTRVLKYSQIVNLQQFWWRSLVRRNEPRHDIRCSPPQNLLAAVIRWFPSSTWKSRAKADSPVNSPPSSTSRSMTTAGVQGSNQPFFWIDSITVFMPRSFKPDR